MKIGTIVTITVIERFEHAMIVRIGRHRSFEFAQSGDRYVDVLIEIGKIDRSASEIRDNSERCDRSVSQGSIEIAYDVCAAAAPVPVATL